MQPDTPVIDDREIELLDAAWRAANYLTVGQIYLQDNPLLREPLAVEHVKPRLLGHWGTSPGLSLLYTHLNRVIGRTDRSVLFMTGPGHGGPAVVANVWLEGTYSEIYDEIPRDLDGMRAAVPAVLHARRHAEPRERSDSRVHPRRRRARLRAGARASARSSTTPTCSSRASWATARPRPLRSRASWKSMRFLNAGA